MTKPADGTGHHLVQAPIRPLDEDGVTACVVGTVGFSLATVALALRHDSLVTAGHGWYLWVAISGIALGLVGLGWCRRRQARR